MRPPDASGPPGYQQQLRLSIIAAHLAPHVHYAITAYRDQEALPFRPDAETEHAYVNRIWSALPSRAKVDLIEAAGEVIREAAALIGRLA